MNLVTNSYVRKKKDLQNIIMCQKSHINERKFKTTFRKSLKRMSENVVYIILKHFKMIVVKKIKEFKNRLKKRA